MPVIETPEPVVPVAEAQPGTSKQRAFTATATSVVVSVALSAVASYFINKATLKIHDTINPPAKTDTTEA